MPMPSLLYSGLAPFLRLTKCHFYYKVYALIPLGVASFQGSTFTKIKSNFRIKYAYICSKGRDNYST